ncbi:MAG: hypothetical protein VB017_05540 [Endomicrobiaceae bacterium]|nr:hypothetical protein [Endomicrobiaceae bacterium]
MKYKADIVNLSIVFVMCIIAATSGWFIGCFFFCKELFKDFNSFNICCFTINLFLAMPFLKGMLDRLAEQEEWLKFQREFSIYGQACLQIGQKSEELSKQQITYNEYIKSIEISSQCKENLHQRD